MQARGGSLRGEQLISQVLLAYACMHACRLVQLCVKSTAEFLLPRMCSLPPAPAHAPCCCSCARRCTPQVRTGCGKSQASRYIIDELAKLGKKCVLVRHPMPYGNLAAQAVQRFANYEDLAAHKARGEQVLFSSGLIWCWDEGARWSVVPCQACLLLPRQNAGHAVLMTTRLLSM